MTVITLNPETSSQLSNLADLAEIRDESGRLLGYFQPANLASHSGTSTAHSPCSDDELRVRQQQRTGKPLSEVFVKLQSP